MTHREAMTQLDRLCKPLTDLVNKHLQPPVAIRWSDDDRDFEVIVVRRSEAQRMWDQR